MSVNFQEYIQRIQNEEDIFSKARLLEFLVKDKKYKLKDVAEHLEVSSSYVCNYLRILKLPELVRDGYYAKLISPTHLFVLARLSEYDDIVSLYEVTLAQNLSTTDLEAKVREVLHGVSTQGRYLDTSELEKLQEACEMLDDRVSAKVIQTRIKAKIVLSVKGSLEDTSDVLQKLHKILKQSS